MKSTGYNLIMSALYNGRKGVRPAAGNPTSIVYHDLMDSCGVSFPQARYAIRAGVNIIGPEYAIPLAMPLENLKAVVSAVREGY
ncbi:MAG: hypothetical protein U9R60_17530 [Bacteroidota bacterium]|nr:hypothetical protein [Bacteroidota bacterium]